MKKAFLFLLSFIAVAHAKEYTPSQLKQMVNSGNYPEQGLSTSQSSRMNFTDCVLTTKAMMSEVASNYPVSTLVDTSLVYSVKAWVNDASIIVTCSEPDGKRVITQSPYK
ncbi:hypothetical protein QMO40_07065 [Mannheimia bovis]|uniref:hypothetical protein n=1 Tax=Mannheimia bovis TaxID=2770636 RepID=UPI0024B6391B|nr:hypothetical protein [Mannheimia bovis]WHP46388.1 hypothetical protein QMO40_07065 [Mannheimia bovis]